MKSNAEILAAISRYGSVRKAAAFVGMTHQGISSRFRRLAADDPQRVEYERLRSSRVGRDRKWPKGKEGDRARRRAAAKQYRARKRKAG